MRAVFVVRPPLGLCSRGSLGLGCTVEGALCGAREAVLALDCVDLGGLWGSIIELAALDGFAEIDVFCVECLEALRVSFSRRIPRVERGPDPILSAGSALFVLRAVGGRVLEVCRRFVEAISPTWSTASMVLDLQKQVCSGRIEIRADPAEAVRRLRELQYEMVVRGEALVLTEPATAR